MGRRTITRVCGFHPLSCSPSRSSWKRLLKPGSQIWTRGSTLCPLTSPVMVFPSSDFPFEAKHSWSLFQVQVGDWMGCDHAWVLQGEDLCRQAHSVCFQLFGISQCLTHVPYSPQQSGTAEYGSNCLVIYVTLNISQGDPEVRFVPKPAQCLGRVTF